MRLAREIMSLRDRWGEHYNIGWDQEFVAGWRQGGATVFAPTADALQRALEFDMGVRLDRMTGKGP